MSFPLLAAMSGLQFGLEHLTVPGMIIGGVLVLFSAISWAVLLRKWLLLRASSAGNLQFLAKFRESPHPLALYLTRDRVETSPMYHVYLQACRELAFYLVGEEEPGRTFSSRLQGAGRINVSQMGAVQMAMERAVASAATRLEARLSTVSTILAAAPFLGLLGTAWGILEVFAILAQAGDAGISALAPGIASALIPTILAMLVSVPCLVGHNMIVARVRAMIVRLDNFANELSGLMDRQFVDHQKPDAILPSLGAMGAAAMPRFSHAPLTPSGAALSSDPTV